MAWYDEAVFYHIYPLGMTGAPMQNNYEAPVSRLNQLLPMLEHIKGLGCNAIYIGPLFESVGHGYETTDYRKLDSRLGTNEDLTNFVKACHQQGIRVIFDGVFNHTGRDFFAFKDLQKNREASAYKDWYCNVNFYGNNEYNDGFSYDNWGGYNLLVKLNQRNPAVRNYIHDVIRFWVSQFDVDGIRLDAADVLDFEFMKSLRSLADQIKPEFWLMGEVIHGDYTRWVNDNTLHCVTNYQLHKALYSGHNDHNYFEIAHTVKRLYDMGGNRPNGLKLYNFVDNHDVERIITKLTNKAQYTPVHILLYTLPGIPSVYYGSELGIEGKKEKGSDASLRPAISCDMCKNALTENPHTQLISTLGRIRRQYKALSYGDYKELTLTNQQYVFSRCHENQKVIICVNNADGPWDFHIGAEGEESYTGLLSGNTYHTDGNNISFRLEANSGDILVCTRDMVDREVPFEQFTSTMAKQEMCQDQNNPATPVQCMSQQQDVTATPVQFVSQQQNGPDTPTQCMSQQQDGPDTPMEETQHAKDHSALIEQARQEGIIQGLQEAILAIMSKNGPITDRMRRDVENNVYHDSLINWIKSFR